MKLKCKMAYEAWDGFLGIGAYSHRPISGLTQDKTYFGQFVPIAQHIGQGTDIFKSDIKAMIYNDLNKWEVYDPDLFEPVTM